MNEKRNIYSLSSLNQSLERFIRDNFALKNFWVIAEITKAQEKNGHHYLELADSKSGKRTAEMSANMWFSTYNRVNEELNGELHNIFKAGNKVLINVRIEFHTVFGLKLNVLNVDPSITFGEIEKKKKETIAKLKSEGLFDLQKELKLPAILKRIVLVGSQNTSGYRDFLSELKQNNVYTNFKVKEISVSVQGDRAVKEIVAAIKMANQFNAEAIVMVRGGGSKMDLNVFNEFEIAQTIAESRLPVITGIGHENDEVVADLVANTKQITPTAVAKFLYIRIGVFKSELESNFDGVLKKAQQLVAMHKDEFTHTSKYLVYFTRNLLNENDRQIRNIVHELKLGVNETLEQRRSELSLALSKVGNYAQNIIALKKSTELFSQLEKVKLLADNSIDQNRVKVSNLSGLLNLLNPEVLLEKGYTITTIDNIDLVKYDKEIEKGAVIKTLSNKNLITSKVTSVKANK